MEGSRKRKFSDGEATLALLVPEETTHAIDESRPTHQTNTDNTFEQHGSGRTYIGSTTSDQARSHLGDSYTWNNYHGPPPTAEDLEARRHKAFMEALAFRRMDFREMAVEHAYATTCQWIFKEEAFLRWRDPASRDRNRGVFWIKGKPGSGKSTLMKCVLEHIRLQPDACTVASFFFNARGEQLERSTEGCYRTLLHQLLEQVPRLLKLVRIPAVLEKDQSWQVKVLQGILRESVLLLQQNPLVLVIDALDECLEKDIRDMVRFLENLTAASHLHGVTLWICLASRHYPSINTRFCESLVVEAAYDHAKDVRNYVQDHLNVEPTVYRSLLSDQLVRKSEGVFLWAVLVVRNINEEFDHGATQDQLQYHLSKIPKDLSVLIGSIVASRASDKHCLPALLWMLSGHYHMTLGDLYHGIKLGAGNPTFPFQGSNSVDRGSMVRFIVNVSGGLIEMPDVINIDTYNEEPHNLQFIHESVRQYILIGGLASLNSRLSCDVAPNSHAILLEWCQTYIQLPLLSQTEFPIDHQTKKVAWDKLKMMGDYTDHDAVRDRVIQAFPFLEYISEYMLHHMDAAFAGNCYELDWLCDFPLQDWINVMNVMLFEGAYYVPSTSLLHFLLQHLYVESTFDTGIIKGILEKYPAKSTTLNHDEDTMEVVLKRGAEICIGNDLNDFCGGLDGTPLVAAASNRTVSDIQMLLDRGADPNICGEGAGDHQYLEGDWEAPLQAAASHAKIDVVTLLLDHGANVNHRGGFHGSALSAAMWTSHEGCRQLLLDRGADINLKDSKGRNIALHGSRHPSPNDDSLRWLIAHGARAGLEQANELLRLATEKCNVDVISLLVQLGADPNNKDIHSRTGLHIIAEKDLTKFSAAYRNRRLSLATSLLDLGADVNALGGEYDTCLIAASSRGDSELVRLFLDRGAEVYHRSDKHGTALEAAEAAGHQAICSLLRLAIR